MVILYTHESYYNLVSVFFVSNLLFLFDFVVGLCITEISKNTNLNHKSKFGFDQEEFDFNLLAYKTN